MTVRVTHLTGTPSNSVLEHTSDTNAVFIVYVLFMTRPDYMKFCYVDSIIHLSVRAIAVNCVKCILHPAGFPDMENII